MSFLASIAFGLDSPAVSFGLGFDATLRHYAVLADLVGSVIAPLRELRGQVVQLGAYDGQTLSASPLFGRTLSGGLSGRTVNVGLLSGALISIRSFAGLTKTSAPLSGDVASSAISGHTLGVESISGSTVDSGLVGDTLLPSALRGLTRWVTAVALP